LQKGVDFYLKGELSTHMLKVYLNYNIRYLDRVQLSIMFKPYFFIHVTIVTDW